jgi:predicted dehydrogenase
MNNMNRRTFIRNSFLATASLSALPRLGWTAPNPTARVRGANGDIRVAVVGFNGRGRSHIKAYLNLPGVRVVALCDVDQNVLDGGKREFADRNLQVEAYRDVRKLLENPDIDAVSIATPNHWHSLCTVWATEAGKDVYVEKPISHNVWEGRKSVEAARKYDRIVQAGTQSRSSYAIREAFEWVRAGNMGKIVRARGLCYKRRKSIGKVDGPQPIPPSVDYNLWTGPAPLVPLMRKRLHYDWHWVWPTGNGDLGNQGVHQVDMCRWALGMEELSPRVFSIGGRLGYIDDGNTPNTLIVFHDYKPAPLIFEVRGLPSSGKSDKMDNYRGASIGLVVDCEDGYLLIKSYSGATAFDNAGHQIKTFQGAHDHFENFINAVRSRRVADLNADILEGHLSAALCHTANISYRLGKPHLPEEISDAIQNNKDMAETFGRMQEHMAANQVDFKLTPIFLGEHLKMDAGLQTPRGKELFNPNSGVKKERFVGNPEANEMLTRRYRAPFVVPANV